MAKRQTNRLAWGLAAGLAAGLLGGTAGLLTHRVTVGSTTVWLEWSPCWHVGTIYFRFRDDSDSTDRREEGIFLGFLVIGIERRLSTSTPH